ncbi:MAG: electron transport complex subunit RsxA [Eubacteriaceae bacterium]|nr:electron transport complex subunit RsxA [Eubacteriaceae bacterium]MCR4893985.1 electron transport complex subunit RsxA [Eubacteriales bacterium]
MLIKILLYGIFVNNYLMVQFLGICPFLGVSKKVDTSIGMGLAVTFVMALASAATWAIQEFLLNRFHLEYLQTIAFILVIAALVQFVEMVIKKISPSLYQALGVYLPLITTNCAVLGCAIVNIQNSYNIIQSVVNGVAGALGFTLSIVLFAGIRERLETSNIPKCLEGFPISLISAGIMSLAFLGFTGLIQL